ncbi:MAG: glycosyltransferase [Phycisphaera sp.]|nr:glycosyltransferase [Phycisphaera sp.]
MPGKNEDLHILLAQRFVPEMGGSILWMHEVYRRWPGRVHVITHDHYRAPLLLPECPEPFIQPDNPGRDHVTDANLEMHRVDFFLKDWGLQSLDQWKRYARITKAVKRVIRDHSGQASGGIVVHCVHAVPEVVGLIPLKWKYGKRLRIVCYAHGEEVTACLSSRQLRMLMTQAHRRVDLMIANSEFTRKKLDGLIDPRKVRIQHPGVEVKAFEGSEAAGRAWRGAKGITDDTRVLLTVGRIDPRKNHAAVIRAMPTLLNNVTGPIVYVVAGVGRAQKELAKLASELGVAQHVRFVGPISAEEKSGVYGACEVFAMPGVYDGTDVEGFGIVYIEAAACGKPSVAGKVGGMPEAVLNNQTGLIVDGHDQSAVDAALLKMLTDADERQRLGKQALDRARELDWQRVFENIHELVEGLGRKEI